MLQGEYVRGRKLLEESCQLGRAEGDRWLYAWNLIVYCTTIHLSGEYKEAQQVLEEAKQILTTMEEQLLYGYVLNLQGRIAADLGQLAQATTYHQAALTQRLKIGTQTGIAFTLRDLGYVYYLQGKYEEAEAYFRHCINMANETNMLTISEQSKGLLGNIALAIGDYTAAKRYFQQSNFINLGLVGGMGWAWLGLGELAEAKKYFLARLKQMIDDGGKPTGLDALVGLAHVQAQTGQLRQALMWLVLVQHHHASMYEIKEKARQLWEELTAKLPAEIIAEAESQGRELDLRDTAVSLLNKKTAS